MRNFRLGARSVNAVFVKEAKTDSFLVSDKRKDLYKKHAIPDLHDDVWRLRMIVWNGPLTKSLAQEKIKTVGDFIVRRFLNHQCLVEIFNRAKQGKNLKISEEHALTCPTKLKYPSSYQHGPQVVFTVSGEVWGLYLRGQFLSRDRLSESQKEDAKKLVISAFENWGDVMHVDEDQLVADCSNPAVCGPAKTETVTPCHNTLVTTYDKNICLAGLDLHINELSLFDDMLSDEKNPNPHLLPKSLSKPYNEIHSGFKGLCTSIELVGTKTVKRKRFCRRWRMLVWVVTFTRPSTKRSLDDIRSHKKPRLS